MVVMAMSNAITGGIRIRVESVFLPEHSDPDEPRYVFAYRVHMRNEGDVPATLQTRHWVITDGQGHVEEVRGPGVIGQMPRLESGESHEYQSFSVLKTARGSMHGSFQMVRDDGEAFDAEIATFVLKTADEASRLVLN